jgi:hypothetical protein
MWDDSVSGTQPVHYAFHESVPRLVSRNGAAAIGDGGFYVGVRYLRFVFTDLADQEIHFPAFFAGEENPVTAIPDFSVVVFRPVFVQNALVHGKGLMVMGSLFHKN